MSKQRLEWKVGLFVLVGLALTALMIMRFSKGGGALSKNYEINLKANDSGGIIEGAGVLMAGVPVGNVVDIQLSPQGDRVTMVLSISSKYKIPKGSRFGIGTIGFLGDRYIQISPGPAAKPNDYLENGDTVEDVASAFEFSAVAADASGLMRQLGGSLLQLSNLVDRIDRTVLSAQSLEHLSASIANFRQVSEKAIQAVDNVNSFVETNTPSLNHTITNFALFTEKLNGVTLTLQETIATNQQEITSVIRGMGDATERVNGLLQGIEEGKGLAGKLLKSDEVAAYTATLMSNMMVFSSNLNNKGLWGVIRKPKTKDD